MKFLSLKNLVFLLIITLFFEQFLFATPVNNRYDPVAFYNCRGTDKFYFKKDKWKINFDITPFYMHGSGARDAGGHRVPEGDIFGKLNMLTLFFGSGYAAGSPGASPTSKPFTFKSDTGEPDPVTVVDNYTRFSTARRVLDGKTLIYGAEPVPTFAKITELKALYGPQVLYDLAASFTGTSDATKILKDYTNENEFDQSNQSLGCFSIPIKYEKMGLRGLVSVEFPFGLGINLKGGFVDIKQRPIFHNLSHGTEINGGVAANDYSLTYTYMMQNEIYPVIFHELGLNVDEYHRVCMEDTHLQVYWGFPFDSRDENDNISVSIIPYVSMGLWLPTGQKMDPNRAFSMPASNDGNTWGLTLEGNLNFDLPGTIQLGAGGGVSFYGSKNMNMRVPATEYPGANVLSNVISGGYQNPMFCPWMANVRKRPGTLWYVNLSFAAPDFIKHFSFYFDYIYTQHQRDSITVNSSSLYDKNYFKTNNLREVSKWKDNKVHMGLSYRVSNALDIGLTVQAHISGVRVYRTTTIGGTVGLTW